MFLVIGLPGSGKSYLINQINNKDSLYKQDYFGIDIDDFAVVDGKSVITDIPKLKSKIIELDSNMKKIIVIGISDNIRYVIKDLDQYITKLYWLDTPHHVITQRLKLRALNKKNKWWHEHFRDKIDVRDWVTEFLVDGLSVQDNFEFVKFKKIEELIILIDEIKE